MYLLLISLCLVLFTWFIYFSPKNPFSDFGSPLFISVVIVFCFIIISAVVPLDMELKYSHSFKLHSVNDNVTVSGRFYLFGGNINSNPNFMFYIYNENTGTFTLETVPSYLSEIKYGNNGAWLHVYKYVKSETKHNSFFFGIADGPRKKYVFEIPEGSIKQTYNLDAQ